MITPMEDSLPIMADPKYQLMPMSAMSRPIADIDAEYAIRQKAELDAKQAMKRRAEGQQGGYGAPGIQGVR